MGYSSEKEKKKKGKTINIYKNINRTQNHYVEGKKPDTRVYPVWSRLHEILKNEK